MRWATFLVVTIVSLHGLAAPRQNAAAPVPDYSSRAREVVAALAGRRFDQVFAQYNDTKSPTLSPTSIGNAWDRVLAQSGAFQRIDSVQVADRRHHVATITCVFDRGSRVITIYFDDAGRIAGLQLGSPAPAGAPWTPPSYVDASRFHEEPVTVTDGSWRLPGTLTMPNGNGPFPAVVLLSGSGPNDADETIGPNKPLKDLAWGLASRGTIVLRYAKRTHVYGAASSADPRTFTVKDEYVDDARAAVAWLASHRGVERVVLIGHSEGGYLAPRIAEGDPQIAGIVILEGNTRSIERAAVDQLRYLAGLEGPDAASIRKMLPDVEAQAAAIEADDLKPGTTVKLLTATIPSSYVLDLRRYDPGASAARLQIPIYVAQGGRDYQVTRVDFAGWQQSLADRPNATLKLYPSLDHLLVAGEGPSTPGQYTQPGRHVSAEIVDDLAAWITTR